MVSSVSDTAFTVTVSRVPAGEILSQAECSWEAVGLTARTLMSDNGVPLTGDWIDGWLEFHEGTAAVLDVSTGAMLRLQVEAQSLPEEQ